MAALLPEGHWDGGLIGVYVPQCSLMPAKTLVFIAFVVDAFGR